MAQRDKEEAELRVPETLALCINNCGFHGNPATKNMCQSCFQASGHDGPSPPPSCSGHEKARSAPIRSPGRSEAGREGAVVARAEPAPAEAALVAETAMAPLRRMNRCAGCRKRVGLTGFRCRCGDLFCAEHRYSERHVCSYDYKAAGREAIARENPVVRAAKIVRI